MKKLDRVLTAFLVVLVILAVFGGCSRKEPSEAQEEQGVEGVVAEEAETEEEGPFGVFMADTQEGEEVTQEVFAGGKLTLVNIWGTFCGPCIQEMPDLGELSAEYADRGLQVVGIVSDVTEPGTQEAWEIIEATGADYMHIIPSQQLYENFLWEVQAVPTTIFVDSKGRRVGDVVIGARDKADWIEEIEKRLQEVEDGPQEA